MRGEGFSGNDFRSVRKARFCQSARHAAPHSDGPDRLGGAAGPPAAERVGRGADRSGRDEPRGGGGTSLVAVREGDVLHVMSGLALRTMLWAARERQGRAEKPLSAQECGNPWARCPSGLPCSVGVCFGNLGKLGGKMPIDEEMLGVSFGCEVLLKCQKMHLKMHAGKKDGR